MAAASRHLVRRAGEAAFAVPGHPWAADAAGYGRWPVVGESAESVHTGFGLCRLEPGGRVSAHVHSFEESVFVTAGEVVLQTPGEATRVGPGDYALVPQGVPHSWRNEGGATAEWAEMLAPQPRARFDDDTVALPAIPSSPPAAADARDPRARRYGHIEPANMDPSRQSQDLLAQSASMRTALLVYSGITVKMMVDGDLGARQSTMFMVQYDTDGVAGPHDHPFEEVYYFLEGRAEGTFDGRRYTLESGDVAFAGVGCVHAFRNVGDGPLRWLETQAPQPPSRHSYRFVRDWDYLAARLDPQQKET